MYFLYFKKFLLCLLFFLFFCSSSQSFSENKLIDDFSGESQYRWQFYTDQVMGGISSGNASIRSDNKDKYVRLQGRVSTANNGGFIQIRREISNGALNARGLLIRVRGNGEKYYVNLNTSETISIRQQYRYYYQANFITSDQWTDISLPFNSAFKRSNSYIRKEIIGDKIRGISILAYGKDHNAFLEVSHLSFY